MMTNAAKTLRTTADLLASSGGEIFLARRPHQSSCTRTPSVPHRHHRFGDGDVVGGGFSVPCQLARSATNTIRLCGSMIEIAVDKGRASSRCWTGWR